MARIDIVLDGPPGPEAGRFVEVEDEKGRSVNFGEWVKRPDGYWALRIATPMPVPAALTEQQLFAMWDAQHGTITKCSAMRAAYKALYESVVPPTVA